MTITEKADMYSKYFTSGTRDNGDKYVYLIDNMPEALIDSVHEAHGDRLPNDWTYSTYADLLQRVTECDLDTAEQLEDVRHEIVDNYVSVYTHDLTAWLAEDIRNVDYITQVITDGSCEDIQDGWRLLAMAQYFAIDEVMQEVINLLSQEEEAQVTI